jgi:hypothetical protein
MARSTLTRLDTLREAPVPGERYRVPTVRHDWLGLTSEWPVMGPRHDDEELGFYHQHYHIDLRFLTPRQAQKMRREYQHSAGRHGVPSLMLAAASRPLHATRDHPAMPEPVLRIRRCMTTEHAYPVTFALETGYRHRQMAESYANRRCGRDSSGQLICPHKGFALGSLTPDAEGRVVCPLHGLVIDTRSGTVVPPPPKYNAAQSIVDGWNAAKAKDFVRTG